MPRTRPRRPLMIVGIGASAGGLEALKRLFSRLRPDLGLSYVVILHLSPDYESNLAEVLQRGTVMPVLVARDGVKCEPDHVYVIPPGSSLGLSETTLKVRKRDASPAIPMPVDVFLRDLAHEQGQRAVAVVLSGSGHDGAVGVAMVKGEGGIVFAQDAKSAGQRSMPQSAVATGSVDFALPPEAIASELGRLALHPYLVAAGGKTAVPHEVPTLRRVFALVRAASGLDFSQYKQTTVVRRLMRRLVVHKLDNVEQYLALLEKDPKEIRAFCEETLIHVTHFFREPEAFAALKERVLPRLLKNSPKDAPIRVWVPGCSTGEEAYSLAITLIDALGERAHRKRVQVFATDVSEAAVNSARAGVYPQGIAGDVPPRILRRYFTKNDGGYRVAKAVRDACIFAKQNLAGDPPFANVDIISCRNVLIYLEPALQKRILPVFHYALKPFGALILGSAETVGDFSSLFAPADKKTRIYFKKPGTAVRFDLLGRRPLEAPDNMTPKPKDHANPAAAWLDSDVQKAADRLLLSRYAPAGLVINAELEILHFRGAIGRFLKPASGKASLSLQKMLPDAYLAAVRALVQRVGKSQRPAKQTVVDSDTRGPVDVEVLPCKGPISGERCFIVLFAETPAEPRPKRRAKAAKADEKGTDRLRRELTSTKDYLQAVIEDHEASNEELKAANEEIISSNEELQSTNEELETAKEELQAANEELTTLNEELQTRNVDLNVINNDLVNLLASVHLPIIMLGSDLRIRRFTPVAERVMNLIPGDIGRQIGDIKLKIDVEDLEQLVTDVIESVVTKDLEVRDKEGRWYSLRIRPYKTTENKIDGAVLVLVDIDVVKKASLEVREKTLLAEAVLDMVTDGVVVLDAALNVAAANPAFLRLGDASGTTVLGRSLLEVSGGRWNIPALRAALEGVLRTGAPFTGMELVSGSARYKASARRLPEAGRAGAMIFVLAPQP